MHDTARGLRAGRPRALAVASISSELARPVSLLNELDRPALDEYVDQLEQRFKSTSTGVDYEDEGSCVDIWRRSTWSTTTPPSIGQDSATSGPTHSRIDVYIDPLPGSPREELRAKG